MKFSLISQLFNFTLKGLDVGVFLGIILVVFILPPTASLSVSSSSSSYLRHENENGVPQDITHTESRNTTVYNLTCQYDSMGMLIPVPRNFIPGLLKDVNEIDVVNDSIFFLVTSCSEDLLARQSCAVESAARTHPERLVYVLFLSPIANLGPDGGQYIKNLSANFNNIHILYLDIFRYTNGTKMQKFVQNQALLRTSFIVNNLADGLRLLTLCKYGGVYFDLDVVVMHSLGNMSNFLGELSKDVVNNAVMSMKANGTLVNACLDEFLSDFRGDFWGYNGLVLLDRAIKKTCERKSRMLWENCDGDFSIYPPEVFYPIPWQKWHIYFEECDEEKYDNLIGKSTTVHLWNRVSKNTKVKVGSNALYGVIASKYCPLSYWNAGDFF